MGVEIIIEILRVCIDLRISCWWGVWVYVWVYVFDCYNYMNILRGLGVVLYLSNSGFWLN